jgi:sec-independent protein translocase protein TatA
MAIALLALVALIVFGPKKLPEMGRQLGKGMRSFKESVSGLSASLDDEPAVHTAPAVAAAVVEESRSPRDDLA